MGFKNFDFPIVKYMFCRYNLKKDGEANIFSEIFEFFLPYGMPYIGGQKEQLHSGGDGKWQWWDCSMAILTTM